MTETTSKNQTNLSVNRTFKSRIFEMIFSEKKNLLELYNAANGTNYTDPELLEINTLENAIYMTVHNDISFIIDSRLSLYEHQSTYNPNMPLRNLFYISDLLSNLTKDANLYGKKLIQLPTPRFLVFYNGEQEQPDCITMKLSDSFIIKEAPVSLELIVTMLNINPGHNTDLLNTCKTLNDYSKYTLRVREYAKQMPIQDAVAHAIEECMQEGILSDFLSKNKAEAIKMSIYEYDFEKHMKQEREESYEDGYQNGRQDGYQNGRQDGYRDGHTTGEMDKLLSQIQKKLAKEKSISEIADELEESVEVISALIEELS